MGKKDPSPLVCSDCAKECASEAWMEYSQAYRDKVLHYQSPRCELCGKRESTLADSPISFTPQKPRGVSVPLEAFSP